MVTSASALLRRQGRHDLDNGLSGVAVPEGSQLGERLLAVLGHQGSGGGGAGPRLNSLEDLNSQLISFKQVINHPSQLVGKISQKWIRAS